MTQDPNEVRDDGVKELFQRARELAPDNQDDFLAENCRDTRVRMRVQALLEADIGAGRFLSSPTAPGKRQAMTDDNEFAVLQRALAGRYSLDREIGRGGMGVVYLARDVALSRLVAVKQLPMEMAGRPEYRARFLSEVRTAAGMTHPNIVPIHLVDEKDDVVSFVMSFVEGETLRQLVERVGPLSPIDAARTMQEVAWALAHAHGRGIVHRDVKPDNILIERATGRAVVTDFGIAATLDAASARTMEGVFLGTPLFASPEQAAGQGIDHRSDLYSLGATIFFTVAGRPVFEAPSAAAALSRHINEPAPRAGAVRPDLPRALSEAIDRCLAKDPGQRFQSAADLAKSLDAVVSGAIEVPEQIRRVVRDFTHVTTDIGSLIVFLILGLAGWWLDRVTANGFLTGLMTLFLVITLVTGGIFIVLRGFDAITEARDALRRGYSPARIRKAMRETITMQHSRGQVRGSAILLAGSTLVTAICWFWNYYSPVPDAPGLGDDAVWLTATMGPLLVGRLTIRHALLRDDTGRGRMRRIIAGVGGFILRLASWRLRRPATLETAPGQTEVVLVDSAVAVLSQLPTAFREHLSDVPQLMKRLQTHADALRLRRDEIEQALAAAGASDHVAQAEGGDAGGVIRDRTESARIALATSYQQANARLADVIAALESIRLGLLRLRGGVAIPSDLTADLELAWQVGDQVDALMLAWKELDFSTSR